MKRTLFLFSSNIEKDAVFANGDPEGITTGITGVGLIDAGIGTTRIIEQQKPEQIIFMGTCGAYPDSMLAIGDVLVADEVMIGSGDIACGWMRFPKLLPDRLKCNRLLSHAIITRAGGYNESHIHRGDVACTLGITEMDELAESLHEHDEADVENLEAFSVLRAAGDIPTAVVLGVTNIVGSRGGRDWAKNYKRMMRAVASVLFSPANTA